MLNFDEMEKMDKVAVNESGIGGKQEVFFNLLCKGWHSWQDVCAEMEISEKYVSSLKNSLKKEGIITKVVKVGGTNYMTIDYVWAGELTRKNGYVVGTVKDMFDGKAGKFQSQIKAEAEAEAKAEAKAKAEPKK